MYDNLRITEENNGFNHFTLHFERDNYVLTQSAVAGIWNRQKYSYIRNNPNDFKRLQYNTTKYRNYLIIDIDNENIYKYRENSIPEPNFIIKNRHKKGAHLFYVLNRVIINSDKSQYYIKQWEKIHKAFSIKAGGDIQNVGFIGKNMFNDLDFEYIELEEKAYSLKNLYQYTDNHLKTPGELKQSKTINLSTKTHKVSLNRNIGSRNTDLFNSLRLFAYSLIKKQENEISFKFNLELEAKILNSSLTNPLEENELRDIINSISKYCLKNVNKILNSKDRGKLNLDNNLSIKEKQVLGGKYSKELRISKTITEIKKGISEMKSQGIKINTNSVSKYLSKNIKTIRRYKYLFEEV